MSDTLRKLIKELIEEELDETTSSSAAGPYNTPFAFRGNSAEGKAKQKKNSNQAGYEMVTGKTDAADPAPEQKKNVVTFGDGKAKKPVNEIGDKRKCHRCSNKTVAKDGICGTCRSKEFDKDYKTAVSEENLSEGRYSEFKLGEGHPRQKIGRAIREINQKLHEIDGIMKMNARLKKESGLNNDQLWKSTVRGLSVLEGRLNTLATRIREMKG